MRFLGRCARRLTVLGVLLAGSVGQAVTLRVAQGELSGLERQGVQQFLGVPYARAPLGALRWRSPLPAPGWAGVRPATTFGSDCVQGRSGKEDCLYLNIYRPPGALNAPLMVWIHGGFFTGGTGRIFDGSALAREYGLVVVTLNYRVGVMGFLAARDVGNGNYGLYDLLQALRWVKQNAAALGGNAGNVTVFGNSAGAAAICTLLAAPGAAGLFDKAILQSGNCLAPTFISPLEAAQRNGQTYVNHFVCPPPVGECLRRKTVQELTAVPLPSAQLLNPVPLPPVYGDALLPSEPGRVFAAGTFHKVPVLLGTNQNEVRVFEPFIPALLRSGELAYHLGLRLFDARHAATIAGQYPVNTAETALQTMTRALTDRIFSCPALNLAADLSKRTTTFMYEFSDPDTHFKYAEKRPAAQVGAVHGSEIPYVLLSDVEGVGGPQSFSFAQRQLAQQISAYWVNFARSGRPAALGLTAWTPFTPTQPRVLSLAPGRSTLGLTYAERHQCAFWQALKQEFPSHEATAIETKTAALGSRNSPVSAVSLRGVNVSLQQHTLCIHLCATLPHTKHQ